MEKVNDENIIELNLDKSNDSSSKTSNIIENDFDNKNLVNNNDKIEILKMRVRTSIMFSIVQTKI